VKSGLNVAPLFNRVAALSYEIKLAIEIESRAEHARQQQAILNADRRLEDWDHIFF
jgi:hypothetical protein